MRYLTLVLGGLLTILLAVAGVHVWRPKATGHSCGKSDSCQETHEAIAKKLAAEQPSRSPELAQR